MSFRVPGRQSGSKADTCTRVHAQSASPLRNSYCLPRAGTVVITFHALSYFILKIILWVGYFACFTDEEGKAGRGEGTRQRSDEASKLKSRHLNGGGPVPSRRPCLHHCLMPLSRQCNRTLFESPQPFSPLHRCSPLHVPSRLSGE